MFKTLISATKAMVSVVALVLAFTLNASAQDRNVPNADNAAQKMADNMKAELSLTDAQYNKVLDLNKNFTAKAAEARKSSTDKKQTAQAVKALNEEREASLKTILNEDQYKKYVAKKEERKKAAVARMSDRSKINMDNVKPKSETDPAVKTPQKQ